MDVFEALTDAGERGRPAVMVTVVAVGDEAPSHPGAKIAVVDGAVAAGTLGCSEFDAAGVDLARSLAQSATTRQHVVFGHGEQRALDLFAERYDPKPAVVIVGATPVGRAVARFAELIGRRVRLLDEPDPLASLRSVPLGAHDTLLLSDHDARYVDDVLRHAFASEAAFVGMLGSRRHVPEVIQRLRERGAPDEQLARLHSPCGLDIGSRTPEEIALSIVAEVVAAERGHDGGSMSVDWSAF